MSAVVCSSYPTSSQLVFIVFGNDEKWNLKAKWSLGSAASYLAHADSKPPYNNEHKFMIIVRTKTRIRVIIVIVVITTIHPKVRIGTPP